MDRENSIPYENRFNRMSELNYIRPAQIPLRQKRFRYLIESYTPSTEDKWIMFHHPNHFIIYDGKSRNCIFDATYQFLSGHYDNDAEDDALVAVISEIRINTDTTQYPPMEDDFGVLMNIITAEL